MLKTMLMAGAALIAVPAMAQDAPQAATPASPRTEALPPSDAQQGASASPSQSAPAPASQDATAAAPAAAQPATTTSQVAQVVQSEFPGYDKDKSGTLSKAEFGDWMGALRKASDASFNPASPEAASWSAQAFAAADTDKNGSLSQAELTAFLAKGKS